MTALPSDGPTRLLIQLQHAAVAIPISVPHGVPGDALAELVGDPVCEVVDVDPDKVWEFINRVMD